LPDGQCASESGATKDTRSPDASRLLGVLELREASGVRRVHRRFAPRRVLKKVEPLDSKSDDLLQVTDLLTGCVNHRLGQG